MGCNNVIDAEETSLLRPSTRVPYIILCKVHYNRMLRHNCCPTCGLFCTQVNTNSLQLFDYWKIICAGKIYWMRSKTSFPSRLPDDSGRCAVLSTLWNFNSGLRCVYYNAFVKETHFVTSAKSNKVSLMHHSLMTRRFKYRILICMYFLSHIFK